MKKWRKGENPFSKMLAPYGDFMTVFLITMALLQSSVSLVAQSPGQQVTIKGRVISEKGEVLAGATVQSRASQHSVLTNNKGEFTIRTFPDGMLTVGYVGYESREVLLKGATSLDVTLKVSGSSLNDVVVVGYGTQRKMEVTGAISVVSSKMIESRPVTNALAALQGAAPGLVVTRTNGQPGKEGYAAQIRGLSSINGSSPLILVDGVEQASIGSLDQNEIESVSILKDASAAAIYGARGANGVILVTTKRGKAGKITVSYSGIFGINHAYNVAKKLHSYQEASMLNEARINAGNSAAYTPQQIAWMKDPDTNYVVNVTDASSYDYYYDVNMVDSIMKPNRNTSQTQQNLMVSGGDNKTQYLFSLGWYDQGGVFRFGPDNENRYNARVNLTTKFSSWLSLDSRIAYSNQHILSPAMAVGGDYGLLYSVYELRSLWPVHLPGTNYYALGGSSNQAYAELKDGGKTDERTDNFNGVFTLQSGNWIKGLNLRAIYAPYLQNYNDNNILRTIPLYNRAGASTSPYNNPNSYTVTRSNIFRANYQFLADYDWKIGMNNNFHVLGGYQLEDYRSTSSTATAKNLSSNQLFSLNLGDPTLYSASDAVNTWATESYFGRLNYNYAEKYFIEGIVRRDGSSKLAPGYRYNTFPSVSAGWRMNKEDWFHSALPFFNEFKLRASYGRLGNSDLSNFGSYDYIATITRSSAYPFNNAPTYGYYNNTLASPQKTWEKINTSDIGLDLSLLKNRLTFSGDYYIKKNINMLVQVNTTAMIGINTAQYNAAAMKSWGWEFNIGWKDVIGKDFSYWFNGNLSDSKNKVLKYNGQSVYTGGLNSVIEGEEVNTIWGYKATGLFSTAAQVTDHAYQSNITAPGDIIYQDMNHDGKINAGSSTKADHGDLVKLGSTTPRYTFGFNLGASYKGFDLSAFFQGVGQRGMLINPSYTLPFVDSWRQPVQGQTDTWEPTHMNARFPRLYLGGGQNLSTSSWWVQNAAYLRLKNLQIGYNLPAGLIQKVHMNAVRIYFTGQDLFTTTKMWLNFYDPEEPNNSTLNYPFFRSYAMGLNITF